MMQFHIIAQLLHIFKLIIQPMYLERSSLMNVVFLEFTTIFVGQRNRDCNHVCSENGKICDPKLKVFLVDQKS